MMNIREKALYHQIHPIKLFTDISTSLMSLYLFWQGELATGLLIGVVPSIVVSLAMVRFANLDGFKRSSFGRYITKYMTTRMQALRLAGQVVVWAGALYHLAPLVVLGFLMILLGWVRGKLFP
jgi:hypothetical protein